MNEIFKRKSIKKYKDTPLKDDTVKSLLYAAMAAPSAGNTTPWNFLVVNDKEKLLEISTALFDALPLRECPCAILVCGDLSKKNFKEYLVQDCSAATENMLLEATSLGLGSLWIGVHPDTGKEQALKKLFNIPENIIPFSLIAVGYTDEDMPTEHIYHKEMVHFNNW